MEDESPTMPYVVRPTRYAHCGESPRGAAMMRNQIAKGNCDTVMWGGEEAGGETQTG